eukprot:scaffold3999_cov101-Isochrysis_galbana.AAC.1
MAQTRSGGQPYQFTHLKQIKTLQSHPPVPPLYFYFPPAQTERREAQTEREAINPTLALAKS